MTPLERHCGWLLRAYPAWYLRRRGEEMLDTLLESSPPGRLHQPPSNLGEQRIPPGATGIGALSQHWALGVAEDARPQARIPPVITRAPQRGFVQHQPPQAIRW